MTKDDTILDLNRYLHTVEVYMTLLYLEYYHIKTASQLIEDINFLLDAIPATIKQTSKYPFGINYEPYIQKYNTLSVQCEQLFRKVRARQSFRENLQRDYVGTQD